MPQCFDDIAVPLAGRPWPRLIDLAADLGKVAAAIAKPPYEKLCVSWLAQVVARLHVRGKGSEAHAKGLRDPVDEDAEAAVQALGLVLRDIDWAA